MSGLARELGVSAALIYRWREEYSQYGKGSFPGNGIIKQTPEEMELSDMKKRIRDIEIENDILKKSAGHHFQELTQRGVKVSRTTVAIHMKKMELRSKLSKKFKVTTDSEHKEPIVKNLLDRKFKVDAPSLAWVSDITYLPVLGGGFTYLTTVLDLFDRKIIGWSLSDGMRTEETVLAAFNMAVKNRSPKSGMIFHSDRGVQYASKKMANVLDSYKIRQSMS